MKKTLLAVAIPALLASGAASATTLYDNNGTKVDIKGSLRIGLNYSDNREGSGQDGTRFKDMGSRFGFKVTHDLGDGLYGLGELEYGNNTQSGEGSFNLKNRLGYVGLGLEGVGEFTFGRVLSPFDDVAMSDYTYDFGGILEYGHGVLKSSGKDGDNFIGRVSNTAKFMSADFNGFSFGATYSTQSDSYKESAPGVFADDTGVRNAYTLSAFYDTGFGLKVNAGYGHAKGNSYGSNVDVTSDIWGVSAEYTVDALSLAVDLGQAQTKAKVSGVGSAKARNDLYGFGAKYNLGKANVYAGYYLADGNKNADFKSEHTITVGTDYQFTPSVRTYVEYANVKEKYHGGGSEKENKAVVGMRVYF